MTDVWDLAKVQVELRERDRRIAHLEEINLRAACIKVDDEARIKVLERRVANLIWQRNKWRDQALNGRCGWVGEKS